MDSSFKLSDSAPGKLPLSWFPRITSPLDGQTVLPPTTLIQNAPIMLIPNMQQVGLNSPQRASESPLGHDAPSVHLLDLFPSYFEHTSGTHSSLRHTIGSLGTSTIHVFQTKD
ncbi:hypothetical protein VNO78_12348 [Psophocarpus tetragonolobus]|uniref:Uncharacterized protein n=1 Tax=Psophocarpus tetragonolobus TaxID=3891 RepID=A0AAN9XP66_PSOTE